jgi:RNA polymerase-binding transcription factor DksA
MRHPQPFSVPSYEFRMLLEAQRKRLIRQDDAKLAIDEALTRIHEGNYGICIRCAREIDRGRLKAEPTTEHCMRCHGQA